MTDDDAAATACWDCAHPRKEHGDDGCMHEVDSVNFGTNYCYCEQYMPDEMGSKPA